LESGQIVVLYTDGVVEAVDENEVPFGEDKMRAIIREYAHASADEILQELKGAVDLHRRDVPQSDDITLIVLRVK